ncbi:DUF2955 domain-containing protein [Parahaliea aestuarii]|uniref:DUF2955 domain-containing protein n=1 Tax=Parahaliea aestuarii TaxID=1852021 RepID=A0A5C8ZV71_9GAMM|nr:DUF2955 domain-containing protein [Parahaliea aestuarii]TXS91480.1 DUF2955 domain-containing protein [Parahaliea aestuarii]
MATGSRLPLAARRSFRLATAAALAVAAAYGLAMPIPFIAPLLAVILGASAKPPPGPKQLLVLLIVLMVTLGIGVVLGPLLQMAPVSALLLITAGLYLSQRLAVVGGKDGPATLLAFGFTIIPAASTASQALAAALIGALLIGTVFAVISLWLAYALFPEDDSQLAPASTARVVDDGHWLALRATLVVMPAFLLTLTNPATYLPLTVKSILLGREASDSSLRNAAREMIGATALGGLCAIALWACLSLAVELWFFSAWVLLFALWLLAPAYGARSSRFAPGFWINSLTTMMILLGAAVQDSANGKDVYQAFAVRMALFLAVAAYAVLAHNLLQRWRERRLSSPTPSKELQTC